MKKKFLYFILFLFISQTYGQSSQNLAEKTRELSNQKKTISLLTGVSNIIDSDTESFFAYNQANELVSKVNSSGTNYHEDLSKIYSAYSYIFYGMSYTRTIKAVSRGDDYSLKELSNSILEYEDKIAISNYELSKKEIASIYSIINFYKVSRMPKYIAMNENYNRYYSSMEKAYKQYDENDAYNIASLNNKKLFFKTLASLVIDIYLINNRDTEEKYIEQYFKEINNKGEKLDKIPNEHNKILNLTDKEYFNFLVLSSQIQKEMIELLATEIRILSE